MDDPNLFFTQELVDKAYCAMEKIEPREQLRSKDIALYGGEPLLAENKEIVEYIVSKGHEKGYKFHALTNGYDLDAYTDLLSPNLIYQLQITIDGTKEYHDKRRIHYKDGGTFDKIVANIKQALSRNINVVVRMNTDNTNVEDFAALKQYFKDCGFSAPSFKIYSAMIWNSDEIPSAERQTLDLLSSKSFISKHKLQGTLNQCRDFGVKAKVYQALSKGKSISFCGTSCGSQTSCYVFDPLGDIYTCWEIVGNKDFKVGCYLKGEIEWNQERLDAWHNYYVSTDEICRKCKYALFCGGGCAIHAMFGKREHCAYFKTTFENSVNQAFQRFTNK